MPNRPECFFFELTSPEMADMIACLHHGKVEVFSTGDAAQPLASPSLQQLAVVHERHANPRIVSVTRGRTSAELCYAVDSRGGTNVFAQVPGTGREQQLFHGADTRLSDLDFSPADEALACTVAGDRGTSAIGVLSDDGKGMRTVTEGDVIDRAPRWMPGGRAEIVYSSAGIGRTKAGKAVGRAPFALHRLRFSDSSVEVLMSDAQYDYVAAVPLSDGLLYALRRDYEGAPQGSAFAVVSRAFRGLFSGNAGPRPVFGRGHDLVRITPKGSELVARDVLAFDVANSGDVVYSSQRGLFRISARQASLQPLASLESVEQLVIYW